MDGPRPGTSATTVMMSAHMSARITPHMMKNHGQLARSAMADARTCPTMPATRKAVDIAPIALARRRGATASGR